ncbi:MAG: hypothetical protein A2879_03985 [Omnitrophica WOR_2 bacterium RIFCSPHIGHO2_01_FULL_49_10]|nr:MAG: hypothetical protein A2879_03985 [Omnitrophica WOR_2 bacterium RIFCSPHIGHO2_01_FULL_49_10]
MLGRFHDGDTFEPIAKAALSHPSPEVRRTACWALPRVDNRRSIPLLIELLNTPSTSDEGKIYPLAIADALSTAINISFSRPVYHSGDTEPVAFWEDDDKWKEWAKFQKIDEKELLPKSVLDALNDRRLKREPKK